MVEHYFRVTFRHIRKHLLISVLNISGLAIGIACFVLIILYVDHELHYDRFNEHFEDIYRVAVDARIGNTVIKQTWTPAPMPAAMYEEFPEVRAVTRISDYPVTVKLGEELYNEDRSAFVDSSFTDIFTLDFLEGGSGTQLNEPGQVLIDRSTARKYYGDSTAIGGVFFIYDTIPLTVTGVFRDFPGQAHFHFNILISLMTDPEEANNTHWFANNFETYLRLEPGFPENELEAKLPAFTDKYLFEGKYDEFNNAENYWKLYLQQLREIHLGSDLNGEFEPNGNLAYIRIFTVVAFLVLMVACINFMNLSTASASIRAREVGVRKTNGAFRKNLRRQFYVEAITVSILSLILAMGLVESLMGPYRGFTGREISLHYLGNFMVIPGLLGLTLVVGLLSGSYPAMYMSRFSPVESLGYKGVHQSKSWFRNFLVLFQFSIAIFLIASTFLVQKQMHLIMDESLGFDKEKVIAVDHASYIEKRPSFSEELKKLPGVTAVSWSTDIPGDKITNWGMGAEGVDYGFSLNSFSCSPEYKETMGLEMARGRFFDPDRPGDVNAIILNETAVRELEIEDPIGRIFYLWGDKEHPLEVIGVVRDFHWESKHMLVRTLGILHIDYPKNPRAPHYVNIKFTGNPDNLLPAVESLWEENVASIPFDYDFLDTHYEAIYRNEKQTQALLFIFAGIAIFISCLGLFGLASFMAARRTKEIGIRKTNGATTGNILGRLSMDFTRWVLLANILAWPLTWFAMKNWLQGFAYRVGIPLWIFIASGTLAFVIALGTVSFHAIRASRQNPGLSLRYE